MSENRITSRLKLVDEKMKIELKEIQEKLEHNGNRGTEAETKFREFLKEYLPPINRVGEGEIIDSYGNYTTQLDIVVTNEFHPYLNKLDKPELFIIEGVQGVGEVKTNLQSKDIKVLINSCIEYKNLKPNTKGNIMYGNPTDNERFVDHRPYFIFAYTSQMKIETIWEKLTEYYRENNIQICQQIDAIFCLDIGAIINFGDGKGSFCWRAKGADENSTGLVVTKDKNGAILLEMMLWISACFKKIYSFESPILPYLL